MSSHVTVKVGLCGFSMGAAAYYAKFPVVEVQQTFYDPPARATLDRWRAQAPTSFEFTIKAWQVITHRGTSTTYRRLKSPFSEQQRAEAGAFRDNETVRGAWITTLECARRLRATAILFQCPASFKATEENANSMRHFFGSIERPSGLRMLWEPRGPWPDPLVAALCEELDLVHATDPFVRPSLTPELIYWRLHGNGSAYASYSDEELEQLHNWLGASNEAYVMFNNVPRVQDVKRFTELSTD
jgi:uncharacterized protein YecE (DUF72 family)